MNKLKIKNLVKDNFVYFTHYSNGELWYEVQYDVCNNGVGAEFKTFAFPVPITDVGNATMLVTDKAILFMQYISNHIAAIGFQE